MASSSRDMAHSPRINVVMPTDTESQSYDSFNDNRLSSSFTRSYYSNVYKPNVNDDDTASYTQDEDSIRSQTLALANQGLLTVTDDHNQTTPLNSSNGYQSNLSQLMTSSSRPKTLPNSPSVGPIISDDQPLKETLQMSDEEDFVEEIIASEGHSKINTPCISRPLSPLNHYNQYPQSRPQSVHESSPLLLPPTNQSVCHGHDGYGATPAHQKQQRDSVVMEDVNPFINIYNEVIRDIPFTDFKYQKELLHQAFLSIPAVLIGTMLNILDAVSFGVIIFPTAQPIFSEFGPDGISIFLVSTVIAQLIYSGGGSRFGGGNGGFMIEVVPFLHIICNIIINDLGEAGKHMVIPTTLVAYALSTVVTGLVFLGLGWFKLGSLMEFFPRHILIGCIGGVGVFLFATAMELTTKISPTYDWAVWLSYLTPELLPLWSSSLLLACLLQLILRFIKHPLVAPIFFLAIPITFYTIILASGDSLPFLREVGWLFPLPSPVKPFYDVYLNFDLMNTSWSTLPKVIPAIFALTFFGILHVPINVPALAVSTGVQDIDINRELVGHGISNLLSGLFCSVQNYLIYSNSVLFIRSGGHARIAGLLLCLCTFVVFLMGTQIVGYIPTPLVGSLIFHLGYELVKEAVWDTRDTVHVLEYVTIVSIVSTMALVGFIEGIFFGIVLACLFFVLIYSHRSPIRTISDGTCVSSTVRRLYHQRTFLESVGHQVKLMYLQGFMFFGTIHQLDHSISHLLQAHRHRTSPIRFLILDFDLVAGIDFSACDAFSRILYRLSKDQIYLVICGVTIESDLGKTLRKAGIWSNPDNKGYVKCFAKVNQALEWCENTLLSNFYQLSTTHAPIPSRVSTHLGASDFYPTLESDYSSSPRDLQLQDAAAKVFTQINETASLIKNARQPLGLLIQAFQELPDTSYPALHQLSSYFERIELNQDDILWQVNDLADGIYLLEQGLLRVKVPTTDPVTQHVVFNSMESILPGTLVGEVTFLTNHVRTVSVHVDCNKCILWKLDRIKYNKILEVANDKPDSPEASIPYLLTRLALTYSAYDNKLYSAMAMI